MKLDGPPITPAGMAKLRARYDHLLGTERPEITAIVSWAAGNGDRSENGDYIYGRKRMREIDRELAHLARRMKACRVIDAARQEDRSRVWFGATVTIAPSDSGSEDNQRTITLVGDDEQDASHGLIGWSAPWRGPCAGQQQVICARSACRAARKNGKCSKSPIARLAFAGVVQKSGDWRRTVAQEL